MNAPRFIAAALACALLALPVAAQPASPLDGKSFVVDLGPKGKAADKKDDVLTFRDGRFHSRFCDKYGFGTGAYEAATDGAAVTFTTETVSESDGRLVWRGRVEGETIEGTIVHHRKPSWFNRNPAPRELWFRGRVRES
jgi:opacity protein-like surface antigen